ncbi:hypothetical protein FIBSPDRAFT_403396 [Athelia psychrophila]|uniref:Uncharacterized protein n=1 Tax=Athelia psychrophila TaxID=1759441 RepID=A0A166NJM7_9AGAM|nr:hypothetical protein FIBSPDRAFT_403396 [Fibularhizoctonia sp. CBS 109695]
MLVEAERSERERKARVDEEEERARHRAVDERRERERADANAQYEEMEPEPEPGSADAGHHMNADEPEEKVKVYPLPPVSQMAADLERTGLCVICQDEDANIAIVDCGCVTFLPSTFYSMMHMLIVGLAGTSQCVAAARTSSWPRPGNVPYAGLASSQKLAYYAFTRPNSPSRCYLISCRFLSYTSTFTKFTLLVLNPRMAHL